MKIILSLIVSFVLLTGCQTIKNNGLIRESTIKSSPTVYIFQIKDGDNTSAENKITFVGYFTDSEEIVPNLKSLNKNGIGLRSSGVEGHYVAAKTREETEFFILFSELEEYKRKVVFQEIK
jgi:hypothetical protein